MITKEWTITDIVEKHPETVDVLLKSGMHCFGCMAASYENIEQGALAHGIDVDQLMSDLNQAAGITQ
jgi:hybrid cluster-associated redox disulfide protein